MDTPHNSYHSNSYSPDFLDIIGSPIEVTEVDRKANLILKIKLHYWRKLILLLNIMSLIFSISSFATPRWVEQGDPDHFWRGGIVKCGGCSGKFKEATYQQIAAWSCGSMEGYCETFDRLFKAGIAVLLTQSLFIILSMLSIFIIIRELVHKYHEGKMIFLIFILAPTCETIGLMSWLGISGAKINGECYESATSIEDPKPLCATHGPILVIITMLLSFSALGLFILIRPAVKRNLKNKIIPVDEG